MTTDDDKVSRRYRELARDEPPRRVDDAILAAARRAVDARPAPLVAPTGRGRWYFPLAAAAIIVLAVAVTIHVERERPDLEVAVAPPAPAPRTLAEPVPSQDALRSAEKPPLAKLRQEPQAASAEPAPPVRVAPAPAPAAAPEFSARADAASEMREAPGKRAALQSKVEATVGAVSGLAAASPEQWLQGIADLRRQGRHEEADKALAEFKRAYPGYRIPEAMRAKVEKKP